MEEDKDKIIADLREKIRWLNQCRYIAERFVTINRCRSCNGAYPSGYLCSCGRDNSMPDKDWEEWQGEQKKKSMDAQS